MLATKAYMGWNNTLGGSQRAPQLDYNIVNSEHVKNFVYSVGKESPTLIFYFIINCIAYELNGSYIYKIYVSEQVLV